MKWRYATYLSNKELKAMVIKMFIGLREKWVNLARTLRKTENIKESIRAEDYNKQNEK